MSVGGRGGTNLFSPTIFFRTAASILVNPQWINIKNCISPFKQRFPVESIVATDSAWLSEILTGPSSVTLNYWCLDLDYTLTMHRWWSADLYLIIVWWGRDGIGWSDKASLVSDGRYDWNRITNRSIRAVILEDILTRGRVFFSFLYS